MTGDGDEGVETGVATVNLSVGVDAAARDEADKALQQAVASGSYDGLSAALEARGAIASEAVLVMARAARDKLKERRKNQSQKQRRTHAGAMQALAALQVACRQPDEATLRSALSHMRSSTWRPCRRSRMR